MKIVQYRIVGMTPVIMHNPAGMKSADDRVGRGKITPPIEEAEAGAYRMETRQLCLPSAAFRGAVLTACTGRMIGKFRAVTLVSGALLTVEEYVPLVDPATGAPLFDYEIFTRRAVVMGRGVLRSRPRITPWAADLPFDVDEEMLPKVQNLTDLLNIAGKMVGVGDWRPQKKGIHGRFTAELIAG